MTTFWLLFIIISQAYPKSGVKFSLTGQVPRRSLRPRGIKVIAHPGCSRPMLDGGAASTLRRSSRMERRLALAVLTTERNTEDHAWAQRALGAVVGGRHGR